MIELTDRTGERRIDAARALVYCLRLQYYLRIIAFESIAYESDTVPEPTGGMNMAAMFDYARENGCTHLIVIAGGLPDDPPSALASAQRLVASGCQRVEIFYVGSRDPDTLAFMSELASLSGATRTQTRVRTEG